VTGLPIHTFETPERLDERIEHLGVIYLQIGKFFGFEELFGWEHYDRILAAVAEVLQDDVRGSRLSPHVHSIRFSGADGFFILYALPPAGRQRMAPSSPTNTRKTAPASSPRSCNRTGLSSSMRG